MAAVVVVAGSVAGVWWFVAGRPTAVETAVVVERPAGAAASETVLNASGHVTARRRASLASKITGKLVDVRVEEGVSVERGQVLARLDDSQYRAALDLAQARLQAARRSADENEARLALARLTLARTRRLVDDGVAFQADLDRDRTEVAALEARLALEREQVEVAEREVDVRKTELADTVIRAPFSGVVISKDAQPGEIVSPVSAGGGFTRTGICTVVDMGSLEIEVDVNESYIARVRPGQRVVAQLDAYPDWSIPASVITTVPAADRQKATVLVRIGFDALDPRILPDMGVKVAFQGEAVEREEGGARAALVVPRAAVRQDDGRDVVWVVNDGRLERRAVRVGAAAGDRVEVAAGLSAGERIVVEATDELVEGSRVAVR